MSVQALAQHVDSLIAAHDVACWRVKRLHAARVLRDECGDVFEMFIPHVRSEISYAVAMHEIGHIRGRHQDSKHEMVRERWA